MIAFGLLRLIRLGGRELDLFMRTCCQKTSSKEEDEYHSFVRSKSFCREAIGRMSWENEKGNDGTSAFGREDDNRMT
jgi:hypothetical protein